MEIKIQCPGYEIAADWYEGSDADKILIVLPGYGSSKKNQESHAKAMVEKTGTNVLSVDFSGHGKSPFDLQDTRPAQHLLELICVFDWLKQQYPHAAISVSGSSYGGFLAVQLTQYREFQNLVLRAPAIYKPSTFYDLWAKRINNQEEYDIEIAAYRSNTSELERHPLITGASGFKGDTFVVVHEKDEVVPKETTDAYTKAFGADSFIAKDFWHRIDPKILGTKPFVDYQDSIANWLNNR